MVCLCCFGITYTGVPHEKRSSCPLQLAINAGKCLDCSSPLPCKDKKCLSRSHSTAALWSMLRTKPVHKSQEEARKAYGISDAVYNGPPIRIKDKEVWVPAHVAAGDAPQVIYVVKGVPIACLFSDNTLLPLVSQEGASVKVHGGLEQAILQLFAEDEVFSIDDKKPGDEGEGSKGKEPEQDTRSSEIMELQRLLVEQTKKLEALQAKTLVESASIPSLKDIRETDKDILRHLKVANPMTGTVETLLKTDTTSYTNTLDACSTLLKGKAPTSDLLAVSFKVKDYVREGKEESNRVEFKNGSLQVVKKRKKV